MSSQRRDAEERLNRRLVDARTHDEVDAAQAAFECELEDIAEPESDAAMLVLIGHHRAHTAEHTREFMKDLSALAADRGFDLALWGPEDAMRDILNSMAAWRPDAKTDPDVAVIRSVTVTGTLVTTKGTKGPA